MSSYLRDVRPLFIKDLPANHWPKMDPSWLKPLKVEFKQQYMKKLRSFLDSETKSKKTIYPPKQDLFAALQYTPLNKVKVVILGQDPYHGEGQAEGLSFSVPKGIRIPPSLKNIYKELNEDLRVPASSHGCLKKWADQGVLLLNSVLSVEAHQAASHRKQGWETFTDEIIQTLNKERKNIVYILWGSYAQKKAAFVDNQNNLVLKSAHPSPLSSYRGFFGSKPFSQTNDYLKKHKISAIDWQIDP